MPWCDPCDSYIESSEIKKCPTCDNELDISDVAVKTQKVPWHFWLIVALLVAYLLWRLFDFLLGLF